MNFKLKCNVSYKVCTQHLIPLDLSEGWKEEGWEEKIHTFELAHLKFGTLLTFITCKNFRKSCN